MSPQGFQNLTILLYWTSSFLTLYLFRQDQPCSGSHDHRLTSFKKDCILARIKRNIFPLLFYFILLFKNSFSRYLLNSCISEYLYFVWVSFFIILPLIHTGSYEANEFLENCASHSHWRMTVMKNTAFDGKVSQWEASLLSMISSKDSSNINI